MSEENQPGLPVQVTVGTNLTEERIVRADIFEASHATSIRPAIGPWYDQAGADGIQAPVERMKRLARQLEPSALFSAPEVFSVEDEDGVELTSVVVDVFIPRESDGMAFRDSFFDRLAAVLHPRDFERLAIGVGRLGPAA